MITVPKLWPGETFAILGTGPSLTPADVAFVRGRARVIAVNDSYRLAPWADALYACDAKWWAWQHRYHTEVIAAFAGLRFGLQPIPRVMRGPTDQREDVPWARSVQVLKNTGRVGLEADPSGLRTGRSSGYQALNLCVHLGAARVILLGYDMGFGPGGAHHFFGAHPDRTKPLFKICLHAYDTLVQPLKTAGVEVLNCSRSTRLKCFPRVALEQALQQREVAA